MTEKQVKSAILRAFVAVLTLQGLGACAHSTALQDLTPGTAAYVYQEGLLFLEDSMFQDAMMAFGRVKSKFPYAPEAKLADLRIADVYFKQGKYDDAVGSYRRFLKYNPKHAEAPYAWLRIADGYFARLPSNFWMLPPAAEKDQRKTRQAIAAYKDMMRRYPEHERSKEAAQRLQACRLRLAEHELYVAKFYFERAHYKAALNRARTLISNYPTVGLNKEALWISGRALVQLGDTSQARTTLAKLMTDFPKSPEALEAKTIINQLAVPLPKPTDGQ